MPFKPGDKVAHKSDLKDRNMLVVAQAIKEYPPSNSFNEMANVGIAPEGTYYCTWICKDKKGEGYFYEVELELLG